jgi:MoaA/NifB/PqqE/SkfB family radical SAM enzyme
VPYVLGNIKRHPLEEIWRRHCAALELDCCDDCLMNAAEHREAIAKHVESVAGNLG